MEDDLSLHLQSVWQSSKIGFYCLNAAASAEFVEIFFEGLRGWCSVVLMWAEWRKCKRGSAKTLANPLTGAEAAGFEPANRLRAVNCFRGSLLQPLGHASCYFIGTLSQTLTLRAAFASSTYLLSQIPGPGRSSDDDLLNFPRSTLFKGAIRACGLSIAACFPCSPAPARHLMMPWFPKEFR